MDEIVQMIDKNILTDRSVIIVKVDTSRLPRHIADDYMNKVKKAFEETFQGTEVMVVPRDLEIFIVDKKEQNDTQS